MEYASSLLASWENDFMVTDMPSRDIHSSHKPTDSWTSTDKIINTTRCFEAPEISTIHERACASDLSVNSDAEKQGTPQLDWKPAKAEWMIIITMAVTSLITALDNTVLVPVLPTLAAELHGTAAEAFWAGTSYLLSNAVFQPVLAAISDIFGRREVLLPSVLAFFIGSAMCGWAHNFTVLLAGRVVQGFGGAGIMTLAQVIFADIVPLRQRPKYFAIVLSAWGVGTILGPLIGGAFAEKSTWRWCFWINLPICAVSFVMVLLFVRLELPKSSLREKLSRVDWLGSGLFIASLTSFLIAITWGGVQFAWSSWHTVVPLVFGILGLLSTLAWERYGAREPFLVKTLFSNSSGIFSYLCAMLQGGVLLMSLYYTPLYFTAVRNASPLRSGVNLLPALAWVLPGSAVVSALITRLGHYRFFVWAGWSVGLLGSGLMTLFAANTHTAVWATFLSIFGLGMGMALSSINFSVQACVEPRDAGRAAGMYAFLRNVGMSLGVAIGGSTFQNRMTHELRDKGLPETIAANAEAFIRQLWDRSVTPEGEFLEIQEAYVKGLQGVFGVMAGMCGLALFFSLFIKHFNMDKMLETKFITKR